MTSDFVEIESKRLPIYVYHLDADVALVINQIAYKIRYYYFSKIRITANQPLRKGDVLSNNACYYGNENTEIIPHLQKKKELAEIKPLF